MKRRRWTDETITAYLDGRMTAEERAAFEAALAADGALRERVEAMRQVKQLLAAMPMREPPRSYRLTPEMVARPRRRFAFAPAAYRFAAAAVMVLLLFVGFLRWQQGMGYRAAAPTEPLFGEEPAAVQEAEPPTDEAAPMMAASYEESGTVSLESNELEGKGEERAAVPSPPGTSIPPTPTPCPPSPPSPPAGGSRPWLIGGAGLLLALLGGAALFLRRPRGR